MEKVRLDLGLVAKYEGGVQNCAGGRGGSSVECGAVQTRSAKCRVRTEDEDEDEDEDERGMEKARGVGREAKGIADSQSQGAELGRRGCAGWERGHACSEGRLACAETGLPCVEAVLAHGQYLRAGAGGGFFGSFAIFIRVLAHGQCLRGVRRGFGGDGFGVFCDFGGVVPLGTAGNRIQPLAGPGGGRNLTIGRH